MSGVATVEEVKRHLMETDGVDEKAIAIATGAQRELEGVDLFAQGCPIEVIITKQALKEGWDCSFAYVFCSVAQVKNDKDIQQLLGRVLRMPYALPRRQEAMSRAYAHVVSDSFGRAAGELTQSLVSIGFNPMEATAAIRRDLPQTGPLPLEGGESAAAPPIPVATIELRNAPDLTDAPARDHQRVTFTPRPGGGGTLTIADEIDSATAEAILAAVPEKEREAVATQVGRHQMEVRLAKAPSERGLEFRVPRLYVMEQGTLELVDTRAVPAGFTWDLMAYPPDLAGFRFHEESRTFEVDLDGQTVGYKLIKDDVETYLPGFALDRTESDLIGWLDHEIRADSVRQPALREWLRRATQGLLRERGFSLAQLLRGQFILRRKLAEQLTLARDKAISEGFQQVLFADDAEVIVSDGPDHAFTYAPGFANYPARWHYQGPYKFTKHYYPEPGELSWKTPGGRVTEEFDCARAIDLLDEVEFWVRNLERGQGQFWMPCAQQRTYPDFVVKLKDQRLLVVEYKGADRFTADQEREKRMVGEFWAKKSAGKGLYLMARKADDAGRAVREQILNVIEG